MKNPIDQHDEALLAATRNAVSRHQDIPPTPRDTMAVLMEAAGKETTKRSAPAWSAFRWLALGATALLLLAGVSLLRQSETTDGPQTADAEIEELGIDVAAWDMEIEALFNQLDESFLAYSYDSYEGTYQ